MRHKRHRGHSYPMIECPLCGSTRTRVTKCSERPVRRHKCAWCGHTFKSVEEVVRGMLLDR